jgi:hypothetical protein
MIPFGFIDETGLGSGDMNEQPFLAIGLLQIEDTGQIQDELYKLHYSYSDHNLTTRKELITELTKKPRKVGFNELNSMFMISRHHEFKFDNLNQTNLDKYLDLIKIIFDYKFKFSCIIVDKSSKDFKSDSNQRYWYGYNKYLNELIDKSVDDKCIVILDFLHKPKDEINIVELLHANPKVVNSMQTDSKSQLLLQISDILLGATLFEIKQGILKFEDSPKIQARNQFVKAIKGYFRKNKINTSIKIIKSPSNQS